MDYAYNYGYESDMAAMSELAIPIVLIILGVVLFIALAVLVTLYIFKAIGLHKIAKRRGIRNAWLAWLPFGCDWIAGSISDQYRYVVRAEARNRRTLLLLLSLAANVLMCLAVMGFVSFYVSLISAMLSYNQMPDPTFAFTVPFSGIFSLFGGAASVVFAIFYQLALFDLYTSCVPKRNALYLILGMFFPVTTSFFIFSCRNKDGGMPPRRVKMPDIVPPVTPAVQPVSEPAVQADTDSEA